MIRALSCFSECAREGRSHSRPVKPLSAFLCLFTEHDLHASRMKLLAAGGFKRPPKGFIGVTCHAGIMQIQTQVKRQTRLEFGGAQHIWLLQLCVNTQLHFDFLNPASAVSAHTILSAFDLFARVGIMYCTASSEEQEAVSQPVISNVTLLGSKIKGTVWVTELFSTVNTVSLFYNLLVLDQLLFVYVNTLTFKKLDGITNNIERTSCYSTFIFNQIPVKATIKPTWPRQK